ncbi:MAG: pyridoxamine 5'-phosphate oxidase family protein [Thomasclavelia ramosa]
MMSIVVLNKKIYFQTDRTFRKYKQIKENPQVSLCIDNIQMEGYCEQVGILPIMQNLLMFIKSIS